MSMGCPLPIAYGSIAKPHTIDASNVKNVPMDVRWSFWCTEKWHWTGRLWGSRYCGAPILVSKACFWIPKLWGGQRRKCLTVCQTVSSGEKSMSLALITCTRLTGIQITTRNTQYSSVLMLLLSLKMFTEMYVWRQNLDQLWHKKLSWERNYEHTWHKQNVLKIT